MRCIVHTGERKGEFQKLERYWGGKEVATPPFFFCFHTANGRLNFSMKRAAEALPNPAARAGEYREELWKYDVAEFFLTGLLSGSYLEFNLAANGAWWAAGFTQPRVPLEDFKVQDLQVRTEGQMRRDEWECRASVSLTALEHYGWWGEDCESCLCACAVLVRNGGFRYLTTSPVQEGEADFHRPWDWETIQLVP